MGCFLVCFKGSKDRKRSRKSKKSLPANKEKESCRNFNSISSGIEIVTERTTAVTDDNPFPKLRDNQDQGTVANVRKKVTFDLHVTTFEIVPVQEDPKDFTEDDEIDREVKEEKKDKEEEESNNEPKLAAYPPNHRYQNCESSDDEDLDEDDEASDEDEEIEFDEGNDDIDIHEDEEESYDSYFSLPMESENKHCQEISMMEPIIESCTDREQVILAKTNVRDCSRYINSVLNPVENISHWKEVKVRPTSLKNLSKENLDIETKPFISPEPNFSKAEKPHRSISSNPNFDDLGKQGIVLDASLSTWLVSPNNSSLEPQSNSMLSNSSINQEERPILGALTMEDIKQSSRTSSPRRSPSRSPEEVPIVGTVGGYWSSKSKENSSSSWSSSSEKRGIPNTTSKYREDKRVNLYYTPFETRLERALNVESSQTCSNVEIY